MSFFSSEAPLPVDALFPRLLPESFDYAKRRTDLVNRLRRSNRDFRVALICDSIDICYLTGVREGISWLAVWEGGGFAVSRHMLIREVADVIGDFELLLPSTRSTDSVELEAFVTSELARRGLEKVAVDLDRMGASIYIRLGRNASANGLELEIVNRMADGLRQCKDGVEQGIIRQCVAIAEEAFSGLVREGASGLVGRSELDLARELEYRMIGLGADRQGFPETGVIVASGPNSASAHHSPGCRLVRPGEALLIDWGAEVNGYRSDMTRTLFPGCVPDFARRAYPIVQSALVSAAEILKAGAKMGDVDRAAREAVMAEGFPEFDYGVGHGIGLAIHEAPWLRAHSEEILEEGMVTTVEPGIYLPGQGGIRIESIYVVTSLGADRVDKIPVSLEQMVLE